jgi:X-X-X-Leu-X-X-Gly heptad repeat protein
MSDGAEQLSDGAEQVSDRGEQVSDRGEQVSDRGDERGPGDGRVRSPRPRYEPPAFPLRAPPIKTGGYLA